MNSLHSSATADHISNFSRRRGFTLIELVVSMAIFVIISSVVIVSQRRFGGNILITNLAYDVALSVRQAQVYGISVRRAAGAILGQEYTRSYGIHFGSTGYYVLFVDIDGDGQYNTLADNNGTRCTPASECVSIFKLEQGNTIKRFCADTDCFGKNENGYIDQLDILFHRPDPEPIVHGIKTNIMKTYASASIMVSSPQSVTKSVTVGASGQISIK